ncbi:MAG: discoidin domain-containing protein [Bacteroidota bacterium]|nr:discoidin domain-containing protein [Bacteroidota bacterium]
MKKKPIFVLFLFLLSICSYAEYFKNIPVDVTQPDSSVIHCYTSGDEYFHCLHDSNGYSIVQSGADGYFYYAVLANDSLVPSNYRVGTINPQTAGLTPWLKPSAKHDQAEKQQKSLLRSAQSMTYFGNGKLVNIVIYVRFKGDTEFTKTRQQFKTMLDGGNSTASLKGYYNEVSYGKLDVQSSHFPTCDSTISLSYEDTYARNYFSPYNAVTNTIGYTDDSGSREQSLVERAINAVKSQVPSSLLLDANGDGNIDNVTVVVRGNADGWGKLLWPHQWTLYMKSVYINSKKVSNYIFITENMYDVATMCHEMFHVIGAPDLYHYTDNGIDPIGSWSGSLTHMLAFMKWKYSGNQWITTIPEITKSGDYTLKPLTKATNNCYKIRSPYSPTEYITLEYRKPAALYEVNLPGMGMLITRINTLAANGNGDGPPDEVYVYRAQGSIYSNGTVTAATFSNLTSRTSFNNTTNPRDFLSDGSDAGINISKITYKGDSLTFHVDLVDQPVQKSSWAVTADSYENGTAYNPPVNALDNSSSTIWHTPWSTSAKAYPHWIQVNFGKLISLKGFKYLPRQDMENGRIKAYEFLTSVDGINWTSVVKGTFLNSAALQLVTFPERRCQYAKVLAKSEVNGNAFASMAELDFVFNATLVSNTKWTLLNASSFEPGKTPALAFDSIGSTFWSSRTSTTAAKYPHTLAIDLNDTCSIEGASYLPRQDNVKDGTISKYEFYASLDTTNWKLLSKGYWANNTGEKMITFPKTVCRYVKLVALSEVSGKSMATVAELSLFGSRSTDVVAPAKPTNFRIASKDSGGVKLAWDKDATDNSILYYQVFTPDSVIANVSANELAVSMDTTKSQTFCLMAVDGSGNQSEVTSFDYSNGVVGIGKPQYSGVTVSAMSGTIVVGNMTGEHVITVYNMLGERLAVLKTNNSEEVLDLNHFNGVAIVQVAKGRQVILRKKVVMENE